MEENAVCFAGMYIKFQPQFSVAYCFFFRKQQATNPRHVPASFKTTTGVSNIRKHLYTHHIGEWVNACEAQNIQIQGADAQHAVRKFKHLPEPTNLETVRPQYSKENFVSALAEFVVGDDQVCIFQFDNDKTHMHYQAINVVESPRLKKIFLMLRGELKESDIPGRTKIREKIDAMYEEHLEKLEKELQV